MKKYVITIARGYGSGGKTIGFMLSKALGIPCYDKEILQKASDESGISEKLFMQADEKSKKGFLNIFSSKKDPCDISVIPPSKNNFTSEQNLFNYQSKIIKDIAQNESCIFIGRCADFVLKDSPDVIRVFVNAPYETCVENAMKTQSIDENEAKKRVKLINKQRSDYYKLYTGTEWDNATNYDLCVNTKGLTFEKACEVIKEFINIRLAD